MGLHKDFPTSPHATLDPALRWFPADEALPDTSMEKLMPPLVSFGGPLKIKLLDELFGLWVMDVSCPG